MLELTREALIFLVDDLWMTNERPICHAHHEVHTSNKRTLNRRSLFMKVHVICCFVRVLTLFFREMFNFQRGFCWRTFFPVGQGNMKKLLAAKTAFGIIPGGSEDVAIHEYGKENVYINSRYGFIKYALQHGYSLILAYTFGENDQFYSLSWLRPLNMWLVKRFWAEFLLTSSSWISSSHPHTIHCHTCQFGVSKKNPKKPEVLASFCPSFGVRPSFLCYQEVVVWTPSMAESFNFQLSKNLRQKTWWNGMRFTCKNSNRCLMNTKENLALATENCIVSDRETRRNFCSPSYFAFKPLETWTKKDKKVSLPLWCNSSRILSQCCNPKNHHFLQQVNMLNFCFHLCRFPFRHFP